MRYITSRPWFWTCLIAIIAYIDIRALSGGYVYDDAGSVIKNVVVNGMVDWKEVFTRDYWGTEMNQIQSHKSFRPITTLTLKANYVLAKRIQKYQNDNDNISGGDTDNEEEEQKPTQDLPPTWTFRVINVILHGIVTGLITKATSYVLPSSSSSSPVMELIVGSLFALHPVHAEVVSNITSRGEMLMSIFFILSFLSYAGTRQECHKQQQIYNQQSQFIQQQSTISVLVPWWKRLWGIYIFPWLCMTLSIFSKEQGATALISLVFWDFLKYHGNLVSLKRKLFSSNTNKSIINKNGVGDDDDDDNKTAATTIATAKIERVEAWQFVWRTIVLAVETLIVVGWRYVLNGESSPDFIVAQNPAGFAEERFTRAFSVTWIYCLYIRDALYPYYLSPDWSGNSIDLITNWNDPRVMAVLALWYFGAQSLWSMVVGADTGNAERRTAKSSSKNNINWYWNETTLRQINMSIWAFSFSPFLLSSNILVVVGLMKADRVIYLPLFGFCILEALLISKLLKGSTTMRPAFERRKEQAFWCAHFLLMFQLIIYSGRTHARNLAWSDSLQLWESAYIVNPRSYHTMYNYGYELSLKQRYVEAEAVMRPIGNPRTDGHSNTFVYTMVLYNLRQCDKANVLLDEAFRVIEEKRKEGGPRNSESHLARSESNLLVAKAHCTEDYQEKGRVLYRAVEKDQTNDYAVNLATTFMEKMQKMEELQRGN
ncbi:MAG: hypothetical protein ACI8RD_001397 [Bacillariaceae sp.]|jgi:hypothetical protein